MAWGIKYTSTFQNRLGENYMVNIAYKDWASGITSIRLAALEINYLNSEEQLLLPVNPFIPCECRFVVEAYDTISFEDFVTTEDDEILVTVLKDGTHYIFHGFVMAEEGEQRLRDYPFQINVHATDSLGMLKNIPLQTPGLTDFVGKVSLINIIGGALHKANPDLHIRTWCNIYEGSMDDRGDGPDNDMFSQAKVDVRTFLKEGNEFLDCYEVLRRILTNHFILFYYLGAWNIVRVGDWQSDSVQNYVEYDVEGSIIGSGAGDTLNAQIGGAEMIEHSGEDHFKSLIYAQKEVRLNFTYKIPENLVNNQKLTELGSFIAPLSGVGYQAWQLVGWSQFKGTANAQTPTSVKNTYIKTESDAFGNETDRYYVVEHDNTATAGPLDNFIRNLNTDFRVHKGDRFSISFQHRLLNDIGGGGLIQVANVALLRDGTSGALLTDWHFLDRDGFWTITSTPIHRNLAGSGAVESNGANWMSISIEDATVPADGTVYIWFGGGDVNDPNESHFKDLQITYYPYINGSYRFIKGDFNKLTQSANRKNSIEEEVFISGSPKRIVSGTLFQSDGETLAENNWYRYGVTEEKRYTQLVAESLYNLVYRNFRIVTGTFKGFNYQSNTGVIKPFGLLTKFEIPDLGDGRQYMCLNPRMNIGTGKWTGTLIEIFKESPDGEHEDDHVFNYIF